MYDLDVIEFYTSTNLQGSQPNVLNELTVEEFYTSTNLQGSQPM